MKEKMIFRAHNSQSKIALIIQVKHFYFAYTDNYTLIGKVDRTPENALGFKTQNWDFWAMIFEGAEVGGAYVY